MFELQDYGCRQCPAVGAPFLACPPPDILMQPYPSLEPKVLKGLLEQLASFCPTTNVSVNCSELDLSPGIRVISPRVMRNPFRLLTWGKLNAERVIRV